MSDVVFPSLPGLELDVKKKPRWSTGIQASVSGRELRASFWTSPLYDIELSFEFLAEADGDVELLVGFFNARRGAFDSFLFRDPLDNEVSGEQFGVGDGETTSYQLVRNYGGHVEPIMNLAAGLVVTKNGVSTSAFSVSSTGRVVFSSPPAVGVVLSWSGSFYLRCRFAGDELDTERFLAGLWRARKIELVGSFGVKI